MHVTIRPLAEADIESVIALSLRAWAPVFDSFRGVLGEAIYRHLFPDWSAHQAAAVERVLRDEALHTWIAVDPTGAAAGRSATGSTAAAATDSADTGRPVGFVSVVHHDETYAEPNSSEIEMIAVDPAAQRQGIGAALLDHAVDRMRAHGARLAVIGTGGDPGHAPARAAYERAGFTPLPLVRYYRML